MEILNLTQGTSEWSAARAPRRCASEAPAVMGESKCMTRNELLALKKIGIAEEVDSFKQQLYDAGHAAEAASRPFAEGLIGAELYPATGVSDDYLASFDGITMDGETAYEHKLWNMVLAEAVRLESLPPMYYWQLEHQILVSGVKRILFVVSDGTPDRRVYMFYEAVPGRAEQLVAAWDQFNLDLATFKPQAAAVPVMAAVTEALPAVSVRMDGAIAVISNLDVFGDRLTAFIEGIDKSPSTDQAFADAEAAVKTLEKAEDALQQAEASALAQTSSIDDMRRTVGRYAEMARTTRLMLEKIVKARKEQIRIEIQQGAQKAFTDHCDVINKRLGKVRIPNITPNFAGVMKGKKTITSLRSAVDDELAKAKIDANAWGEKIDANLRSLRELARDHAFLFHDAQQIVLKDNDDLVALIKTRIAEHKATEQAKADKIAAEARQQLLNEQQEEARLAANPPTVEQPIRIEPAKTLPAQELVTEARKESPAPSAAPAATHARTTAQTRPTSAQLIMVIADHYGVNAETARGWMEFSFHQQSKAA